MSELLEQAAFCRELAKRLDVNVNKHEEAREKRNAETEYDFGHAYVGEYGGNNVGILKHQILSDARLLRRELLSLAKMF